MIFTTFWEGNHPGIVFSDLEIKKFIVVSTEFRSEDESAGLAPR